MLTTFVFYILALLAVVTAVMTITMANPVSCALSLIVCLMSLAGLFAQLSAGYLAVLQVLVYAGAIMVLFLFVVMLLNLSREEAAEEPVGPATMLKWLAGIAFLLDLHVFVDSTIRGRAFLVEPAGFGGLEAFGRVLFGRYLAAFEVTSLLLTAAVVGVVLITRKDKTSSRKVGETPRPAGYKGTRDVKGLTS